MLQHGVDTVTTWTLNKAVHILNTNYLILLLFKALVKEEPVDKKEESVLTNQPVIG